MANNIIYKYPISPYGQQFITMPAGAELLTVKMQGDKPFLWALVDVNLLDSTRKITIYETGQKIVGRVGVYVETFQLEDFIGHVFDLGENPDKW